VCASSTSSPASGASTSACPGPATSAPAPSRSTGTPASSTPITGQTRLSGATPPSLSRPTCHPWTVCVAGFLASHFRSPGDTVASVTRSEARSFLTSCGLPRDYECHTFSLRTSPDSSTKTGETPSVRSLPPLMHAGIMRDGRCSTANVGYLKPDTACGLSDVLEDRVHERYYLSRGRVCQILNIDARKPSRRRQVQREIRESSQARLGTGGTS